MKNKAFTLIELLAVIIILGILMLIAIPSVTNYINNSRKSTYVTTVNELVKATIAKVNSGDLNMFDTDTTYYVPCTCIKLENGEAKSPYGKFDPAYVVVTFDGEEYHYYFTGKDVENMGVPTITKSDLLTKETIVANVDAIDTSVGIEGTTNVYVFSDECNGEGEIGPAGTTVSGGSSGLNQSNKICRRATSLHTAECTQTNGGCRYIGYYVGGSKNTTTITYGTINEKGSPLNTGDALDCDVNNDGKYDDKTERFYYITDNGKNAVLLYYTNVEKGIIPTQNNYFYASQADAQQLGTCDDSRFGCNWYGPITAFNQLPSISQWSNSQIISPGTRQITNEVGGTTTVDAPIRNFTYTGKAARFLTYQEVDKVCKKSETQYSSITIGDCDFLMENVGQFENTTGTCGYWLETPSSKYTDYVYFTFYGENMVTYYIVHGYVGVRPVIEVLKSNIES